MGVLTIVVVVSAVDGVLVGLKDVSFIDPKVVSVSPKVLQGKLL